MYCILICEESVGFSDRLPVSCQVTDVGTESDAGPGLQGAATRHSGGYGEEAERSRSGFGAARMPRLLRDRALVYRNQ